MQRSNTKIFTEGPMLCFLDLGRPVTYMYERYDITMIFMNLYVKDKKKGRTSFEPEFTS